MANTTKIITIDQALKVFDDDQLIDYLLDENVGDKKGSAGTARGKMKLWKDAMLLLTDLRHSRLFSSQERDRIRGLLIAESYDTASELIEHKLEGVLDPESHELLNDLGELVHKLWHSQ